MGVSMYYFAYGSNMSTRIMNEWCATFESVGPARLDDYRLAFTRPSARWGGGAADVIPAVGQVVWGVLYAIDDETLMALDRKEGVGVAYRRFDCCVKVGGDKEYNALSYTVIDKADPELSPVIAYKAALLEGAREHRLPASYIVAIEAVPVAP